MRTSTTAFNAIARGIKNVQNTKRDRGRYPKQDPTANKVRLGVDIITFIFIYLLPSLLGSILIVGQLTCGHSTDYYSLSLCMT